jgi:glycosyltransferase involved in cell wall biosynthesis
MAGITLGILARNAAKTIVECLESAAPYVDQIVIGFGGPSDDGTEDLVRQWALDQSRYPTPVLMFPITWQDDFSRARNEILAKVETEWFLWLDADDILINGQLMQAVIDQNDDANCITFPYHYDQDEYGNLSARSTRSCRCPTSPGCRCTHPRSS